MTTVDLVLTAVAEDQPADAPDAPAKAGGWLDGKLAGQVLVSVLAVLSGVILTARIQVPWPWSDEGATYTALQRDWGSMLALYGGPDAPMVPYYYIAKAWTGVVQALWPTISALVATRLIAAAAGVATVVVLYLLVARNAGRFAGCLAGVAVLSLVGFNRYAQEARGYALLMLAATVSWWLRDRWLRPRVVVTFTGAHEDQTEPPTRLRLPDALAYATGLAATAGVHTFGLFQWPAHVVAMAVEWLTDRGRFRGRSWTVAVVAGATLALAAAQVIPSVTHGTGPHPAGSRVVNAQTILKELARTVSVTPAPIVTAGAVVLVLCCIGLCFRGPHARFARGLLIWLSVPITLELVLGAARTNLFRIRYWVALLPPLGAVMAMGALAIGLAVQAGVRRLSAQPGRSLTGVVAVVATVAIAIPAWIGLPTQLSIRALNGHNENLTNVFKIVKAMRIAKPGIPVIMDADAGAVGTLGAIDPSISAKNPLRWVNPAATTVYTVPAPTAEIRKKLAGARLLLWIHRGKALSPAQARQRVPRSIAYLHPRILWVKKANPRWTVTLIATEKQG